MSALGQKQTSAHVQAMSALPLKADIDRSHREFCFVLTPTPRSLIRSPHRVRCWSCGDDHAPMDIAKSKTQPLRGWGSGVYAQPISH